MPIFEYQCGHCSTKFEKIVFAEREDVVCPKCQGKEVQKLFSGFAVQSSSSATNAPEPGPCPCGAAERGMCQMFDA